MRICPLLFLIFIVPISCELDNDSDKYELEKIFTLPEVLSETSGLIIYDSLLWTFNDSENGPVLYGANLSDGQIERTIVLSNAVNIDWEDITQDDDAIYIGDIGNISGVRDTLFIYILPKRIIQNIPSQSCEVESLTFIFEDQVDFTPAYMNSPFDCESLINIDDSLYVFTKDWSTLTTTVYSLPKQSGYFKAKRITTIIAQGLTTAAGYNPTSQELVLCGYSEYVPFIIITNLSLGWSGINNSIQRFSFPEKTGTQIEGIDFDGDQIYLTSEASIQPQAFYEFIRF